MRKKSNSQAYWSILAEGVSSARIEAHRLRLVLQRALKLVEESEAKEHLYQVAGDIIASIPRRMDSLEGNLDKVSYALAQSGKTFFKSRLPIEDRSQVDEALETAELATKVANSFLRKADLMPPLGYPGGPGFVEDRIEDKVRSPAEQNFLKDKVVEGEDLTNPEASRIYKLEDERGAGLFREMELSAHVQFRMDLRGITVPEIRFALASFSKHLNDLKSQKNPMWDFYTKQLMTDAVQWTDPKLNLTIVFRSNGRGSVKLVTTYWKGEKDPKARR